MSDAYSDYLNRHQVSERAYAGDQPGTMGSRVLSDDDIKELDAFREAKAAEEAAQVPPEPTHFLHLVDGSVVPSAGVMTHYKGIPVVNAVSMEDAR